MAKYRDHLPQLDGRLFMTDGGMETDMVFNHGIELPEFASFVMLKDEDGRVKLERYFDNYVDIVRRYDVGLVLETATWRASSDWATKIGYSASELADANRAAVELCERVRAAHETPDTPMVIGGSIGPRGDGYNPAQQFSAAEAQSYHSTQINTFAGTGADFVSALTMNYVDEAVGIVHAARAAGIPMMISFTVETNGTLPSGQPLGDAIEEVDALTDRGPAYYMINCAHPTHFADALTGDWVDRLRGFRANASCRSHAELDEATELDDGNPDELGRQFRELKQKLPHINVLGGCCGTDHRHIEAICRECVGFWH
jgi:S-methylmethionine-dependent homocysteine/selenocysteine methylase